MTIRGSTIGQLLAQSGVDPFDARVLVAHALGLSRVQLVTRSEDMLAADDEARVRALLQRRAAGEPVAYLVGHRDFHGVRLAVSPDVLIPRPETELLVELASERVTAHTTRLLDLGTGSGAIAIALAKLHPRLEVVAVDASAAAAEIARRNALENAARLEVLTGSWYEPVGGTTFDLIVSNPPYIRAGDPHLSQGDLRFEPAMALTDHQDGLSALSAIIAGAPAHLAPGGWLLLEHGYDQAPAVRGLLQKAGFDAVQSWRDLAGIDRVSGGQWPASGAKV